MCNIRIQKNVLNIQTKQNLVFLQKLEGVIGPRVMVRNMNCHFTIVEKDTFGDWTLALLTRGHNPSYFA